MKDGTIDMCYRVLEKLAVDNEAASDILYRELCRQAI